MKRAQRTPWLTAHKLLGLPHKNDIAYRTTIYMADRTTISWFSEPQYHG